jgi:hypothetical protein
MIFTGVWVGWIGWSRLRGTGFPRLPAAAGVALLVLATGVVVASAFVPRAVLGPSASPTASPTASGPRPSSTAALSFVQPSPGALLTGDELEVVLDLEGGRIVDTSTTQLTPDTGHIHLSVDGTLVSMTYGTVQVVDLRNVAPGAHTLRAEFVAADHGPFDPRVTASVAFDKEPSA